jgi:hypothetical protein
VHRKLSELVHAITELSNMFREVYEPRYHATAVLEALDLIPPADPCACLSSLNECRKNL